MRSLRLVKVRRSFALVIWLTVTVTATAMVWATVSVVAADVTDRAAPVVAHHDVVEALAGSAPAAVPATTTTTVAKPATTAPPRTTPVPTSGPPTTGPRTTVPPVAATPRTTVVVPPPPTTKPPAPPPPTTQVPVPSASYGTPGGVATVACTSPFTIRVLSATPNDGFLALVANPGPGQVEVDFLGRDAGYQVKAVCFFGRPIKFN